VDSEGCSHCPNSLDSAQHTLESCPAWNREREDLGRVIGGDFSLPAVVKSIVGSSESWRAFASFCAKVMRRKEAAERSRQRKAAYVRRLANVDFDELESDDSVP